jgi:hypothetical protein
MRASFKLGIAGAVLVAGAIGFVASGMYTDPLYWRDVSGRIVSTGSRVARAGGAINEKIAVRLKPYVADGVVTRAGAGEGGLDIECVSTRCANLQEGECASFECKHDFRWLEQNVVICQLERTVACETP